MIVSEHYRAGAFEREGQVDRRNKKGLQFYCSPFAYVASPRGFEPLSTA